MHLSTTYQGGVKFHIQSGGHLVVVDQPVDDGGDDEGMTPVELFIGSLVTCIGYFVARYCHRHQLPCEGLVVNADYDMVERPHRVGPITVRVRLPISLNPSDRARLLRVAEGCTVHQTLHNPSDVHIHLDLMDTDGLT